MSGGRAGARLAPGHRERRNAEEPHDSGRLMVEAVSPSETALMRRAGRPDRASLAWVSICAFALWLEPSVGQLWKYLGLYGSVAASCVAAGLIFVVIALPAEKTAQTTVSARPLLLIAMLLVLLFVLLFPISRSGLIGGGSDRADALNVALRALLAGQQPYHRLTYLGNPPTPLPGALLLALPFYALGSSALQNLFWGPVLVALASSMVGSRRAGVCFLLAFIVLCPGSLQDFVTGGDYLVNVIYVAVSMHLVMVSIDEPRVVRYFSYILLAVSISSRTIYFFEVPILTALIAQRRGLGRAMEFILATGAGLLAINGPLFLNDPKHFPLFQSGDKLGFYPPGLHAVLVIPAISLAIACWAFFWPMSPRRVFLISTLSFVPMFVPGLIYELLILGPRRYVLVEAGCSLPLTVFGGLWLFTAVAAWSRDALVKGNGGGRK
jgi:hypothetical protein